MITHLIRPVVRIGNSSGVVLPKAWLNQKASIELLARNPLDIIQEVLTILHKEISLAQVLGIYLVGSYSRGEESPASDIDVLIITENINKSIKKGLYELLLISKKDIKKILMKNPLPLLPMIKEAKPLLNIELIREFSSISLTRKSLQEYTNTTRLSIKENKELINLTKELKEKYLDDSIAYSLVLRLRGTYIVDCLKENKLWNNNKLIKLIKKIAGSPLAYERYLYIKSDAGKNKSLLPTGEAEKLLKYIEKKNIEQEKWSKELKD